MDNLESQLIEIELKEPDINSPAHILVVEINDFFPGSIPGKSRSRVIPNILHLLDHVDKHRAEANFYITSELLKDFPEVVSLVNSRGHEVGLCLDMDKSNCTGNIEELKGEIELTTSKQSWGVLLKGTVIDKRYSFKKIASAGFKYCVVDFKFGIKHGKSQPIKAEFENQEGLWILPPSFHNSWGIRLDFGMAGNVRLYPLWFLRRCLREFSRRNKPALLSFPLWEFDPHIPRQIYNPIRNLKSYGNLSVAEFKLNRLLMEFDFANIPKVLGIAGHQ